MYNILHSFSYKESGLHSNQCEKLVQGHTLEEGKSGFKLRSDRLPDPSHRESWVTDASSECGANWPSLLTASSDEYSPLQAQGGAPAGGGDNAVSGFTPLLLPSLHGIP